MLTNPHARRLTGSRRSEARRPMTAPVSKEVGTYWTGSAGMPVIGAGATGAGSSSSLPMNR
jgi:hypothetical protein